MEIKTKTFVTCLTLAIILSFYCGYAFKQGLFLSRPNPQVRINLYVLKETPQGVEQIYSGNMMTDRIEKKIRNIFAWNNETVYDFNYIALGNSSISQTENKLDVEATSTGFARAANDSCVGWINSGDFAMNVTKKFTATGNIWVNATALHEGGTGEATDAVAMASLGGMEDFQNNWNCTIIWSITWNAN